MLKYDPVRARQVAERLLAAFRQGGIFGNTEMPEDLVPFGVTVGSEDHLRFITLTVAIDYMRDAGQLWDAARRTFADPEVRYLFDPAAVANTGFMKLVDDMQRHRLSKKPQNDAQTWQTICTALVRHFDGRVSTLIARAKQEAPALLDLIRSSRYRAGFPFLKGAKIGPLWVRMLHDNCEVPLKRLDEIPLPVDVHTAQATIQLGCVEVTAGRGAMEDLREAVQAVWQEALAGSADYPLRLDEPLWMLSRQGCRGKATWPCEFEQRCPVAEFCVGKQQWLVTGGAPGADGGEWWIR